MLLRLHRIGWVQEQEWWEGEVMELVMEKGTWPLEELLMWETRSGILGVSLLREGEGLCLVGRGRER